VSLWETGRLDVPVDVEGDEPHENPLVLILVSFLIFASNSMNTLPFKLVEPRWLWISSVNTYFHICKLEILLVYRAMLMCLLKSYAFGSEPWFEICLDII
jgi:hypothetical protein